MTTALYDSFARIYDLQHQTFADDAPMYMQLAREHANDGKNKNSALLEIGCGTGRLMLPLVTHGMRVVGVDESQAMLDIAEEHLHKVTAKSKGSYSLVCADARTLSLEETFGLAYIPLNTFLHNPTQADQLAMLRSVRKHLPAGAVIVIDIPPNDEIAYQPEDGEFQSEATLLDPHTQTELTKHVASRIFWATQEQELTYKVEEKRDGKLVNTVTFGFRLRHVFKHEMELLLQESGFDAPRWLGDYDLTAYVEGSPRMIALARAA